MSRYNPKDHFEALDYQLEEDFRVMRCDLKMKDVKGLMQSYKRMGQHIEGTFELAQKREKQ